MRAHALPGLSATSVALGPLRLGSASWSAVDLGDAETVATLRAYVGTHIGLHPDDIGELAAVGLALLDGRLVGIEQPTVTEDLPTDDKPRRRK